MPVKVNQLAVLNAQQTYLTAATIRVQTDANLLSDTAALFMALGGGWPARCTTPVWHECALADDSSPASDGSIMIDQPFARNSRLSLERSPSDDGAEHP